MELAREKKLELLKGLNWDYLDTPEAMLEVVEGKRFDSGGLDRHTIYARSLQRLQWPYFVGLWGMDKVKEYYSEEVYVRIWPHSLRGMYDHAIRFLRGETVSPPEWRVGSYRSRRYRLFSHGGDGN